MYLSPEPWPMECLLIHCLLCADHFGAPTPYCAKCMNKRCDEVKRDAEIRGILGDHKAHGYFILGHEDRISDDTD